MGWYGLDAFNSAFKRTKRTLAEPFDFWKWIRLGIIAFFIGGGAGTWNFNSPASWQTEEKRFETIPTQEVIDKITIFWNQYQTYILIGLALIIFIILLFILISSIMEFVFVESLVTNRVAIMAYFRKYLHPGFNLFIVKIILSMVFLSVFILAMIPVSQKILSDNITPAVLLGGFLWIIGILLILAVLGGIINSFISLAIPVVIYRDAGIIMALKMVVRRSREDWKQIVIYWVARFFAWTAGGIVVGIAALFVFIVILFVLLIPGLILYFILSTLGLGFEDSLFLIVMIPYGLIATAVLIIFLLMASAPLPVLMKFHLLNFVQIWYPEVRIPLIDPAQSSK